MAPSLPIHRNPTFPLANAARQKPRRWPLELRLIKGAVHYRILVPVVLHCAWTFAVVFVDRRLSFQLGLPSTIVPTMSIVVGLMLVFRNTSSYERFWGGRSHLQTVSSVIRNLTRIFLVDGPDETKEDRIKTETVVKALLAMMYTIKYHLRFQWDDFEFVDQPDFVGLLPPFMRGHESQGVGLTLELAFLVEKYIQRGVKRGFFNAPQSAMITNQLNSLIESYGQMETIKLTPIPVCHQIHQRQVLALYCCTVPFCLVDDTGWWAIPIMALISFTLYGIEGMGAEIEDPFGSDKNDIKMDAVVSDMRRETLVLLEAWRRGEEDYFPRPLESDSPAAVL